MCTAHFLCSPSRAAKSSARAVPADAHRARPCFPWLQEAAQSPAVISVTSLTSIPHHPHTGSFAPWHGHQRWQHVKAGESLSPPTRVRPVLLSPPWISERSLKMFPRLGDSVLQGLHQPSCLAGRCCFSQSVSTAPTRSCH